MRKILYFLLALTIFAGCVSTSSLLRHGEYYQATVLATQKLMKNPNNTKQADILVKAYPLAQSKLEEQINFLKKEGQPSNWDKIYQLYLKLKDLQEKVEIVTPLYVHGKTIKFEHKNYDDLIIEAKNKAIEYHIAMAKKLMSENNKYAFRQAYNHLLIVKKYDPSYPDLDQMFQTCLDKGTTYALIVPVNQTLFKIPEDFMYNIIDIPTDRLNTQWVIYHTTDVRHGDYDLIIYVVLKQANISANQQNTKVITERKKIQVGTRTVTDSTGQHQVPVYDTIACRAKIVEQRKIAHISGEIQYVDNHTKQNMRVVPIAADNVFVNSFAVYSGNSKACSKNTLKLAKNQIVPFPSDLDMITGAAETLRKVIWKALYDNRGFVASRF